MRAILAAVLVCGLLGHTNRAAYAEDRNGDGPLEEVVVTARKQAERLQDVPISLTAITEATLQRSGAQALVDVARSAPGLNVNAVAPGQNQLVIRGVSSAGGVNTVGYYVDDIPIQSIGNLAGNAMDPALFDLERVEVLRGPQGTLYGASSMGGAVKYVTRQPDPSRAAAAMRAALSSTRGGGMNYEVSGLVNQPVLGGTAALRAIGFYRNQDGYLDRHPIDPDNYLGSLPTPVREDVNTEETYGARVSALLNLNESLSITPSVFVQRTDLGAPFTFDDRPGSFEHPIQTRYVDEPSSDRLQMFSVVVDAELGPVRLTSATSYRERNFDVNEDNSKALYFFFSPDPQPYVFPTAVHNYIADHDFIEELRAAADFGRVHSLVGLFYSHQNRFRSYLWPITSAYNEAFDTPFGSEPNFFKGDDSMLTRQKAVFGEVNVDVVEGLQATVGLRAFEVTQNLHTPYSGVLNGGTTEMFGSSKDTGVNPKFGLSYHWSPQVLTYVSAAKGFRQGGPLPDVPVICASDLAALGLSSAPTSYDADTLWNYELGAKTEWLDGRLTLNGSVYYMDWSEVQQLVQLPTCGFVFTGNFGEAVSKGSELEVRYEPVPSLQFTVGLAYNHAELRGTVPGAQGSKGDTLQNAPKWIGSASAEYQRDLGAELSGYMRLDFSSTSSQFNTFDSSSLYYERAGYSLLNMRVGVERDAWDAALFINNALDKAAETALPAAYGIDLPTTRRISLNRPRTIGLEVQHRF